MKTMTKRLFGRVAALLVLMATGLGGEAAQAAIDGITGTNFAFTAKAGNITTADGNTVHVWGYANGDGLMQYPGPTLIVNQGDTVTITLRNELPQPVSIVFPGIEGVTAVGGSEGLITREAANDGSVVTYTFTPSQPGTYLYHSGTRPDLQVEMGLLGALIVRPAGYDPLTNRRAYADEGSAYDYEHLFLLTEMDPRIHEMVADGRWDDVDTTGYFPVYWFLNGRTAPDTMAGVNVPWLPHQPYNSAPRARPGEKVLMRVIDAGRHLHPFHHHGNNAVVIARDGRRLIGAGGEELGFSDFTIQAIPGATIDAIFTWTGDGMGWDIYGHAPGDECLVGFEICDPADPHYAHGKPFPVVIPQNADLTFGASYSGSPFLGAMGTLPPGEGGMNANAGLFFMWHSHNEKEMTNFDIFPGGMMAMFIVEPPWVTIEE